MPKQISGGGRNRFGIWACETFAERASPVGERRVGVEDHIEPDVLALARALVISGVTLAYQQAEEPERPVCTAPGVHESAVYRAAADDSELASSATWTRTLTSLGGEQRRSTATVIRSRFAVTLRSQAVGVARTFETRCRTLLPSMTVRRIGRELEAMGWVRAR